MTRLTFYANGKYLAMMSVSDNIVPNLGEKVRVNGTYEDMIEPDPGEMYLPVIDKRIDYSNQAVVIVLDAPSDLRVEVKL